MKSGFPEIAFLIASYELKPCLFAVPTYGSFSVPLCNGDGVKFFL